MFAALITHRIAWGVVSPCMYHPGAYFDEAIGLLHNTVTGLITASDWLQWLMERHTQQDAVSHQAKRLNSRGKIRKPRR